MVSSLDLITNNYSYLNGLSGLGCYGCYGFANDGITKNIKNNVKNTYEIVRERSAYQNKDGIERKNYDQECKVMYELLKSQRPDDAKRLFDRMVKEMKSSAYYNVYTTNELKTLIRENYKNVIGTDMIDDAKKYAAPIFLQGLSEGIPIIGTFFTPNTTSDDYEATITGVPKNGIGMAHETSGALVSGVVGGAGLGLSAVTAKNILTEVKNSYTSHGLDLPKILKDTFKPSNLFKDYNTKVGTKFGILGALVGTIMAVIKANVDA